MTNKRKQLKITSLERLEILKEREKGRKAPKGGFTAPPGVIHYSVKETRILGRLLGKPKRKLAQGWKKFLLQPCHPLVQLCGFLRKKGFGGKLWEAYRGRSARGAPNFMVYASHFELKLLLQHVPNYQVLYRYERLNVRTSHSTFVLSYSTI